MLSPIETRDLPTAVISGGFRARLAPGCGGLVARVRNCTVRSVSFLVHTFDCGQLGLGRPEPLERGGAVEKRTFRFAGGPFWVGYPLFEDNCRRTELDWTTEHTSHVGYWAWLPTSKADSEPKRPV